MPELPEVETVRRLLEASVIGRAIGMVRLSGLELRGAYGEQLRVYDRPGEPCRACGNAIRRIVQGARSTPRRPSVSGPPASSG